MMMLSSRDDHHAKALHRREDPKYQGVEKSRMRHWLLQGHFQGKQGTIN
jgi:hypothetical protein